jgi:hypothetical protein
VGELECRPPVGCALPRLKVLWQRFLGSPPTEGDAAEELELLLRNFEQRVRSVVVNPSHRVRVEAKAPGLERERHPRSARIEDRESVRLPGARLKSPGERKDEERRSVGPAAIAVSNDRTNTCEKFFVVGVHEQPRLDVRRRRRPARGFEEYPNGVWIDWVHQERTRRPAPNELGVDVGIRRTMGLVGRGRSG